MRSSSVTDSTASLPIALTTDRDDAASAPTSPVARGALHAAAASAVEAGVELDAWMQAAWSAYVEQRPGLRTHLEELQLASQLDELRQRGRVGQA